ncbi:MAG: pyruvate kinase [Fervidicoccaceae archaeon]
MATMGPAIDSKDSVRALVEAGVDGFRINFSHGKPEDWGRYVDYIKSTEEEAKKPIALIGDLQGPNPRIGEIKNGQIKFQKGERLRFIFAKDTESREIPIPYRRFFELAKKGDKIIMADGSIVFDVVEEGDKELYAISEMDGILTSKKSFSLKGKDIELPYITEQDIESLKFAGTIEFSHIMASIVETSANIIELKQAVSKYFKEPPEIYSKIETEKGYSNMDYIINESHGVVVARGDLGSHFPMEMLPKVQKEIVKRARKAGKPVVIATQLLTSMLNSPIPTRSEIVDIYNAVNEGADALMLTNETAIGNFPVQAVSWLRKTIREASYIYREQRSFLEDNLFHRFAYGLTMFSESLNGKILLYTKSGLTGKIISLYRPTEGFYVGVPNSRVARKLAIIWGAFPLIIEAEKYDEGLFKLREHLKETGDIKKGDILIETYRFKEGEIHFIRIFYLS